MRVDAEEAIQVIGTETVIVIKPESGTGTETKILKGLMRGMAEEVVKVGEGWIGSTTVLEMEEREVEIDTENVTGADHVPLLGVVTEGHPEVQSPHITEFCS